MIDPRVLRELKRRAADEGRTLQDVANDLLKRGLHRADPTPFTLQQEGWTAEARPGVDLTDRDALFDLMDGR